MNNYIYTNENYSNDFYNKLVKKLLFLNVLSSKFSLYKLWLFFRQNILEITWVSVYLTAPFYYRSVRETDIDLLVTYTSKDMLTNQTIATNLNSTESH